MPTLSAKALRSHLEIGSLTDLFVEELGWDRLRGVSDERFVVDGEPIRLQGLVQKRDVPVYLHRSSFLPDRQRRRRIERELSKRQLEHLIVFVEEGSSAQVWQWVKREPNRADRVREHAWRPGEAVEPLRQKLDALQFTLEEEEHGRIVPTEVTDRLRRAFDADRITRSFYADFKRQHDALLVFLSELPEGVRSWYASVTLNRLMFVYFIQKRGFIDDRPNYLAEQLVASKQRGKDRFFADVLRPLFFRGFALPEHERSAADKKLLGKVPYLNGGLFQQHQIERDHGERISFPDRAFDGLFSFFEGWRWHLDERDTQLQGGAGGTRNPVNQAREINPDVLGYIFEKYVNQKQMGAYYTKEDVTHYICSNTILPRLLEKVERLVPVAFRGEGSVWRLLSADPDRYIWPSARHGLDLPLPDEIKRGLDDVARRSSWDRPATREFALPTETWREVIDRRAHAEALRNRLTSGEIASSAEVVTSNLDIARFVQDAIQAASEDQLKAWWASLRSLTVLDPACGSGAFLFAALNLLEPLYTNVFEAMQTTVADARRSAEASGRSFDEARYKPLLDVLKEGENHANAAYFILRQITLNNLYGVDIMEEAAEICKLRLFLKLIAQLEDSSEIEPLPDLDFNIRSGNSLIGFVSRAHVDAALGRQLDLEGRGDRIEREAELASEAFDRFRELQDTASAAEQLREAKGTLGHRLAAVAAEADPFLAGQYGVTPDRPRAYDAWRTTYQPFHWFTEFYGVIHEGGFDVVVGNPPFLEASEVDYALTGFLTAESRAVHGVFVERFVSLASDDGAIGIVLPMSIVSTQRMRIVQQELERSSTCVYANFSWRPATLFDGVSRAITIVISLKGRARTCTTGYLRWNADSREHLIKRVRPIEAPRDRSGWAVPKLSSSLEAGILAAMKERGRELGLFLGGQGAPIFYKSTGGLYWKVFTDFPPKFLANGKRGTSSRQQRLDVADPEHASSLVAMLNSSTFWWWYTLTSNLRDLNPSDIRGFRIPPAAPADEKLGELGAELMRDLDANSEMMTRVQRTTGKTQVQSFRVKLSKPIIDRIDERLAGLFDLGAEHADFIKSYDVAWRLSLFGDDETDEAA